MRDLVKTLDELSEAGLKVTIATLLEGYDICLREAPDSPMQFEHVDKAGDIADRLHLRALSLYPSSLYAARHATQFIDQLKHIPQPGQIEEITEATQIQVLTGQPAVRLGRVGIVMINAPMSCVTINGEEHIAPAASMHARQAMEVGMNLIFIGKIAEQQLQQQEG